MPRPRRARMRQGVPRSGNTLPSANGAAGASCLSRSSSHSMLLAQKLLALDERGARGERQDRQAERLVDPQDEPPRAGISPDNNGNPPPRGRDQKLFRCALEGGEAMCQFLPRFGLTSGRGKTHARRCKKKRGLAAPPSSSRFCLAQAEAWLPPSVRLRNSRMKRSNSSWSFTRRSSPRKLLELGAHRLELAALFLEPLQLLRPVFVESGVAGAALKAVRLAGGSAARAPEKERKCPSAPRPWLRSRSPQMIQASIARPSGQNTAKPMIIRTIFNAVQRPREQ